MLVLSRKQGQQIRISDTIVVTVHRISGNRVSLGIEAPPDCKIMRGELDDNGPSGGASPQQVVPLLQKKPANKPPVVRSGQRNAS